MLPHQCALLSTVTRKIKAQRRLKEVFGYSEEKFTHDFLTSAEFWHADEYEDWLLLVRMALLNELKSLPGRMKNEYTCFQRAKHADGSYRMVRVTISTFNSILKGIPTVALFIFSDFGESKFIVPKGLIINERKPLIQAHGEKEYRRSDVPFSQRERQVLYGICIGESSKMIAERYAIAKKTVDNVRTKLLEKSGAANTAELATKAVLYSWV